MILTLLRRCGALEKGCIPGHSLISGSQKPFTITSDAWLYLHRIQSKKTDAVVTPAGGQPCVGALRPEYQGQGTQQECQFLAQVLL